MRTAAGMHPLRIPLRPMAGCIGTAPILEVPTTANAGRFGGNLDTPEVCPGSTRVSTGVRAGRTAYYIGDCHPYQGDGEVSGCEVQAVVTLSVEVLKGWTTALAARELRLRVNSLPSELAVPLRALRRAGHPRDDSSAAGAARMDESHARLFLTLVGDLRPGQMQIAPYSMRLIVPKEHLPPVVASSGRQLS